MGGGSGPRGMDPNNSVIFLSTSSFLMSPATISVAVFGA